MYSTKAKLLWGGVGSLGVGFAAANCLPNTMLMNELKEIVQMYRYGDPVPIPEKVSQTVKTVMDDMQLNQEVRERVQPFTVYGFDLFHSGSTYTKYGAIVGIPSNFYYTKIEDVDTQNITIQNKPVDWLASCARRFKESLVLSEEAQKFLIAREIASVNSPTMLFKTFYPLSSCLMVCLIAHQFNKQQRLLQKPLVFRGMIYGVLSLFGFGMWVFLQDFTSVNMEMEADKIASALGEEYVRGGLEAYSKLLQRNICLRELMGSKGSNTYTTTGNDVYFIRQKHLPLSHRKKFMESMISLSNPEAKSETREGTVKSSAS